MIQRFLDLQKEYPRQFWLMFWGMLLNSSGASMIWPFLLVFVSKRLDLPLTTIATLPTIMTASLLVSSFIAGPITDRVGRKGVMVFSLFGDAVNFLLLSQANTYTAFAVLLALRGLFNPLYRVGADAMLADLIPPEKRHNAYALTRMVNNAGVSIGPALGGFLAASSYNLSFLGAACGLGTYGLLLALFARETLPVRDEQAQSPKGERWGGYPRVLRDRTFISLISLIALGWITGGLMWSIMPYYANHFYHVPENLYGWIPTTNALMVVFLQMLVTRFTRRRQPQAMVALGMLFYALGNGLVTFATGFWGFWVSMVVMTIGELIIVPTSNTFVANLAPVDMRGRYMSLYGLTPSIGSGTGPVLGGVLSDNFGPKSIWVGGLGIGLLSTLGLALLARRRHMPEYAIETAS